METRSSRTKSRRSRSSTCSNFFWSGRKPPKPFKRRVRSLQLADRDLAQWFRRQTTTRSSTRTKRWSIGSLICSGLLKRAARGPPVRQVALVVSRRLALLAERLLCQVRDQARTRWTWFRCLLSFWDVNSNSSLWMTNKCKAKNLRPKIQQECTQCSKLQMAWFAELFQFANTCAEYKRSCTHLEVHWIPL